MQIKVIRNHITPIRMHVCVHAQLWPTLSHPMDCSLPGSSVHPIFQVRTLECVAISFSKGFSQPRDQIHVPCISCMGRQALYQLSLSERQSSKTQKYKCCQGCGENGPLCTVGGNVNWCTVENRIVVPQKIKNRTTIWSSNSTLGYLYKENENTNWKGYLLQHCLQQPRYGNNLNTRWQMNG